MIRYMKYDMGIFDTRCDLRFDDYANMQYLVFVCLFLVHFWIEGKKWVCIAQYHMNVWKKYDPIFDGLCASFPSIFNFHFLFL